MARGGLGEDFDAIISNALSINNNNDIVFTARTGTNNFLVTPDSPFNKSKPLPIPLRPMISDIGGIVLRAGNLTTDPIKLDARNLNPLIVLTIADSSMGFTALGQSPGISDDSRIVVFYGDLNTAGAMALYTTPPGPGIFASISEGLSRKILRITGQQVKDIAAVGGNNDGICDTGETCIQAAELGHDEAGNVRRFSTYQADSRVNVINLDLSPTDIDGDSFVVAFIATPNAASRGNPTIPGKPLYFSAQSGIWTVRVDVQRQLSGAHNRVYNISGPIPVVQVNDVIAGNNITNLAIFDSLARAATDDGGAIRTQRQGDHRLAFWAQTASGSMVVRANLLDSDQDGLFDHWESTGIDMDQDGTSDLDLLSMGANPNKRDLFLEVDWLADQPGIKHQLHVNVISSLTPQFRPH